MKGCESMPNQMPRMPAIRIGKGSGHKSLDMKKQSRNDSPERENS
jgi:hypothetical protein